MRITKKMYLGVASFLVAAGAFVGLLSLTGISASAVTMGDRRDCGYTDVIINCGATSSAELLQKYDSNDDGRGNRDIQAIFNHYGIQRSDITGTTSEVKRGWLNTNGSISVDGKTVATSAKSLYRVHPGKEVSPVSIAGKTYYIGPVANNYYLGADVFVFFKDGVFHAAIQSSCGNPIIATPTPKPPVYTCDSLKAVKIEGNTYRFTAAATAKNGAAIAHYVYDFGDGTSSTRNSTTVDHTYAAPGTYTATVKVNISVDGVRKYVTSESCKVTIKIEEQKQPIYKCDSLKTNKIDRTTYQFTAAATAENGATIESYTYNFGDGQSTTSANTQVNHTYAEAGDYTATLTVNFKVNGETKTATGPNCKVSITIEEEVKPVYKCDSLKATKISRTEFRFTAAATAENGATIESYTYNFGDGQSTTSANAQVNHTYANAGTYTATLTVNFKVNGETKTATGPNCKVTVTVEEAPVYKCDSLSAIKINRTTYQFNSAATAQNGATIESYTYNFGDGQSTTSASSQVSHIYANAGTYTATLTVNFKVNGETKTATGPNCKVTIIVEEAPVYKCESLKATKISRTEFRFTAAATAQHGAEIVSYTYNFGDGQSTTSANAQVNHTYAEAGTYTATLTVNFEVNGETKTATGPNCKVTVTVEKAPVYKCESLKATKINRTTYQFNSAATAQNGATIESYTYNFGDGQTVTSANTQVNHTYATAGTYTATLTVNFKVNGENKTATGPNCKVTVTVEEAPVYKCDSLTATKISRDTYQFTAAFTAENGAQVENFVYTFGDGQSLESKSTQVNHTYAKAGTYTATLTVNFRVDGERKSVTGPNCKVTVTVEEAPTYKCESLKATKLTRTNFRFETVASAANGAEIVSYNYDFGDGNKTTNGATVEHNYAQAGNYTITVSVNVKVDGKTIVVNGDNCKTTIKVEEEVKPVYKCESLKATKINRTNFRFATDAMAENGAEIVNYTYDFGDGSKSTTTQSTVDHEYENPGNYTVKVTVNVRVNGQIVAVNDGNCKTTITVEEEPEVPVYKCENLTVRRIQNKDRSYAYTLTYAADGGATLDRVVYNFGDGTSEVFLPANAANVEHTYAQPGNYTTTATLYFNVPESGETVEKSDTCEVKITIDKPENCPVPGKEHLPKNSPECKEDEFCAVPGKEHLPVDSPECVTPPCEVPGKEHLPVNSPDCVETPPELPKTGLDMLIGGGIGLSSITAAAHYWISSRRNLNALLNK